MYRLGLIGNCHCSALVSSSGSIEWLCLPRPDSPPVFGGLLDPDGGHFRVASVLPSKSTQSYDGNTNVLVTEFQCEDGSAFRVTDFCPRFEQHGRMYRPISIFRILEPLKGNPQIRVSCSPVNGWEKVKVPPVRGNSHLEWEIRGEVLRLATNMPLTYLLDETPTSLREKIYLSLSWSLGLEDDIIQVSETFLAKTKAYWQKWVQHCSIPAKYQKETIRSALTLKLHCYEETGAILAALTTSLPETFGRERNWDYRYCWLRDAAFVLSAFRNLGHFEEMEGFLKFLLDIAQQSEQPKFELRPVYALDKTLPVPEVSVPGWQGFQSSKPVRYFNQAAEHVQNDVYGELILSLSPIYFDERFSHLRTKEHEVLISRLTHSCIESISRPDAGLWEVRDFWQEHSFTNLMCWAGIERALRLQKQGFFPYLNPSILERAVGLCDSALRAAVRDGALRNGPADPSLDAALLLVAILRFPDKEICKNTVNQIADELSIEKTGFLYRYLRKDDFGVPSSAFLICSFWLAQGLAKIGDMRRAQAVMNEAISAANQLGLFSEHFDPQTKTQLGNYPQAYSHVGLINAAFELSPSWNDLL